MKPFDLEAAKAGAPVVTRTGADYVFGSFNPNEKEGVIGWINGHLCAHYADGRYISCRNDGADLFMAPVKKRREVWVISGGCLVGYVGDGYEPMSPGWIRATLVWEE